MRTAALLIVGDEILSGEIRDENAPYLLGRFAAAGVRVVRAAACPDLEADIVSELTRLRALADAVVVAGGIGPTHDDLTRPAVALALGLPLEVHPEAEARIRGYYGAATNAAELAMAHAPRGARVVVGPRTGTIGYFVAGVYVLPGVPALLRDLTDAILPDFHGAPLHKAELRTDLREGEIAAPLAAAQAAHPGVAIGSYPVLSAPLLSASGGTSGLWHVRVVLRSTDPERLRACLGALRSELETLARGGA